MTTYVYCTRRSKSARALASALGAQRLRTLQTYPFGSTIINWGDDLVTLYPNARVINPAPLICTNKLATFYKLEQHNVSIPLFTTLRDNVTSEYTWLARHTLTGHGGAGITVINPGDEPPSAPLYVKYIPKAYEVRVHVNKRHNYYCTFDVQQKMRRGDGNPSDLYVWSHSNNYVFVRNNITIPHDALRQCKVQAMEAIQALDMDFGAVDVIYSVHHNAAYVLEVNSAPGLEGTTLVNYVQMFRGMIDG